MSKNNKKSKKYYLDPKKFNGDIIANLKHLGLDDLADEVKNSREQNSKLNKVASNKSTSYSSSDSKLINKIMDTGNGLQELIRKESPTEIPFFGSMIGRFIYNPSNLSYEELYQISTNEVFIKCIKMTLTSITNAIGNVFHKNKEYEAILREAYEKCTTPISTIVKCLYGCEIYGHSDLYMRPYIDSQGKTLIERIDYLPARSIIYSVNPDGGLDMTCQQVYSGQDNASSPIGIGLTPDSVLENLFQPTYNSQSEYDNRRQSHETLITRTIAVNPMYLIECDKNLLIHQTALSHIPDANPYGNLPLTKSVANLVYLYDTIKQLSTIFLKNRAIPLIVGYAKNANVRNPDPSDEKKLTITSFDALCNALQNAPDNPVVVLDGIKGDTYFIEAIKTEGDSKSYYDLLEWVESQIVDTLGSFSVQDGSYAVATTQSSYYTRGINHVAKVFAKNLCNTFNKFILRENIDPEITDFGYFEIQTQNIDDQIKETKKFETLIINKVLTPHLFKSQHDMMLNSLSIIPLTEEEYKKYQDYYMKSTDELLTSTKDMSNKVNLKETQNAYKKQENGSA